MTQPINIKKCNIQIDLEILAIDSNYEPITKKAFEYREVNVYPYMKEQGFSIILRQGALARKCYVEQDDIKNNVIYMTGVGHGSYDTFTGQYMETIFKIGNYNAKEVSNKIVHFLSCQTGRKLGPDFVKNGCLAYFGYDENFTFNMDYADIFFECDSEIDRAFSEGLTASQVYERVIALYNKHIENLRNQGKLYIAATLEFDRDHLRAPSDEKNLAWGNPNAKLP